MAAEEEAAMTLKVVMTGDSSLAEMFCSSLEQCKGRQRTTGSTGFGLVALYHTIADVSSLGRVQVDFHVLPPSEKCQWLKISNVFNSANAIFVVYDSSSRVNAESIQAMVTDARYFAPSAGICVLGISAALEGQFLQHDLHSLKASLEDDVVFLETTAKPTDIRLAFNSFLSEFDSVSPLRLLQSSAAHPGDDSYCAVQ